MWFPYEYVKDDHKVQETLRHEFYIPMIENSLMNFRNSSKPLLETRNCSLSSASATNGQSTTTPLLPEWNSTSSMENSYASHHLVNTTVKAHVESNLNELGQGQLIRGSRVNKNCEVTPPLAGPQWGCTGICDIIHQISPDMFLHILCRVSRFCLKDSSLRLGCQGI